jgi:uncharacterized protein
MKLLRSAFVRACVAALLWLAAHYANAESNALVQAAQRGDLAAVQALLKAGASPSKSRNDTSAATQAELPVNAKGPYGMTALLHAAQANDLSMAQALLKAGASANVANNYGITPLWLAATNHSAELVKLLLQFNADAKATLPHGETALMAAARAGSAEVIDLLVAAGANPNASETLQGETALMWAAADNHPDVIRALVKGGANLNAHSRALNLVAMNWVQVGMVSTTLPVGGWTAAMYAARQDAKAAIHILAELGANLDEQDEDGTTALQLALMNAHYDLAAAILEAGANPNLADRTGMTALYAAVGMVTHKRDTGRPAIPRSDTLQALDVVKLLLAQGANPNARLLSPTMGRHHDFSDFELGAGATVLMRAVKSNDLASMRLLLAAGADPRLATEKGLSAIDLAAGKGRSPANKVTQALLAEFANAKQ